MYQNSFFPFKKYCETKLKSKYGEISSFFQILENIYIKNPNDE